MEQFIRARYASGRAQLDAPGDRPKPEPVQPLPDNQGPRPGPPWADAPSDLHTVRVTATSVELGWTNHTEGAAAFVVQRCVGEDRTDFMNAIGQGGPRYHQRQRLSGPARQDLWVPCVCGLADAAGSPLHGCIRDSHRPNSRALTACSNPSEVRGRENPQAAFVRAISPEGGKG